MIQSFALPHDPCIVWNSFLVPSGLQYLHGDFFMSKFAIPVSSSDHQEIRAEKALETYGVNASYICAMPGCSAKMILCDPSSNRTAYFRSIHKADHKYDYCTDSSLSFNPDEYDESKFDLNLAIQTICSHEQQNNIHTGQFHSTNGTIGTGSHIPIRTAKKLWAVCNHLGVNGIYNHIRINDIYACLENKDCFQYRTSGFCIIEGTFAYTVNDVSIRMNYTRYSTSDTCYSLLVHFPSKSSMNSFKKKLFGGFGKQYCHKVRFAVAAVRARSDDSDYIFQYQLAKQSQIFFIGR